MNMKDARRLKPGAIVREAWNPHTTVQGIVLSKQYVKEQHNAKMLCRDKEERYDVTVHWLCPERLIPQRRWGEKAHRVQVRENWEIMLISHVD